MTLGFAMAKVKWAIQGTHIERRKEVCVADVGDRKHVMFDGK